MSGEPLKHPEPDDPMELKAVSVPLPDAAAVGDMADCFIEEFVRLGRGPAELLAMFRSPAFAGPHMAYQQLGEAEITERIDSLFRAIRPAARS